MSLSGLYQRVPAHRHHHHAALGAWGVSGVRSPAAGSKPRLSDAFRFCAAMSGTDKDAPGPEL
eukprot:1257934-Rhodomonas_salina.5